MAKTKEKEPVVALADVYHWDRDGTTYSLDLLDARDGFDVRLTAQTEVGKQLGELVMPAVSDQLQELQEGLKRVGDRIRTLRQVRAQGASG